MSQDAQTKSKQWGNRPPIYKRQYIVDKAFQYRLVGTLLAIWLAYSVFFSLVMYFLYDGHLNQFYELVPREGVLPLLSLPALVATAVAFVAVFGLIVLAIIAVYMSNQIAGPLFRTKKSLERVAKGELDFKIQFRHGDFLNDLPPVFNAMLTRLREQAVSELEDIKAIESAADSAEVKELARKLREKKEAQVGLTSGDAGGNEQQEPVPVAVH